MTLENLKFVKSEPTRNLKLLILSCVFWIFQPVYFSYSVEGERGDKPSAAMISPEVLFELHGEVLVTLDPDVFLHAVTLDPIEFIRKILTRPNVNDIPGVNEPVLMVAAKWAASYFNFYFLSREDLLLNPHLTPAVLLAAVKNSPNDFIIHFLMRRDIDQFETVKPEVLLAALAGGPRLFIGSLLAQRRTAKLNALNYKVFKAVFRKISKTPGYRVEVIHPLVMERWRNLQTVSCVESKLRAGLKSNLQAGR